MAWLYEMTLGVHTLSVDPDATLVSEFYEYPNIISAHWLMEDFELKKLFVQKKFVNMRLFIFHKAV